MTLEEYRQLAARTINPKCTLMEQEMHALHLLSAEVGEIHSLYQKVYQGHDLNEEELALELGDLLWGIAELCSAKGWKLVDIAAKNIEKLRRRYPDGFDEEKSLHRKE